MGKKSRAKKERRKQEEQGVKTEQRSLKETNPRLELVLFNIVRFGAYFALLTPLVVSAKCYFPFVGPKGLYLMGLCQIVFFSWLILVCYYKQYRPTLNRIFTALCFFLIILLLSSIFGVDFSRSFWSKYERMTGLLMWLHLFGFFLAISSTLKKLSDWYKIFLVSISISILLSFFSLLAGRGGVQALGAYSRGGSSLGNSSFLGTYLLFNVFFALWLFWKSKNKFIRLFSAFAIIFDGFSVYDAGARAATLATAGGLGLLFLLFLSFYPKKKGIRILGKMLLVVSSILVLTATVFLFLPDNPVHNKFVALTTRSRPVNWEMAKKGFLERPLLGWGPENYDMLFSKFFNPCLFTPQCGGEIWFDRTHNIVWDTLSTSGAFGFLTYLGLFGSLLYVLGKKYLREKSIDFWTFSVFTALAVAYFIQNLTVFDMPVSLMLFVLVLGFVACIDRRERAERVERKLVLKHRWLGVALLCVFCLTFFGFIVQSFKTDALVIKALQARDSQERVALYKKALEASSLGKYQIRDFFAQHSLGLIQKDVKEIAENDAIKEATTKELDFLASELEKSKIESPLDFRSVLKAAQLYNLYVLFNSQKLPLAEKYGEEAIALSPTNQQGYWALAQTKIYQNNFAEGLSLAQKAVDLEPRWLQSHQIAIQVAKISGNEEKAEELIQKALAINPAWAEEFGVVVEKGLAP